MSQWKPKNKVGTSRYKKNVDLPASPIEVIELSGGPKANVRERPRGWMPMETYEKRGLPARHMQIYGCPASGEIWVKRLVGRYRRRDKALLLKRLQVLEEVAVLHGGAIDQGSSPLWLQVEFLENVLEVRLHPPCGCPPIRFSSAA